MSKKVLKSGSLGSIPSPNRSRPEKQRPFSGADLPSMTLQGSSDEEAAGQFVVLKQACQLMGSIPWGSRGFNPNFLQVNSPFLISRQIHKKKKAERDEGRGYAWCGLCKRSERCRSRSGCPSWSCGCRCHHLAVRRVRVRRSLHKSI